jgi:MraZ protein
MTIDTQAPCLAIYPLPEWERIESDIQGLPALNPAVKRFQRLVLGYASDLELDGNGRVLLPQSLRDYAQLEKKAVLVGQGNKLELWSEDLWLAEREAALAAEAEGEIPIELMSLTL